MFHGRATNLLTCDLSRIRGRFARALKTKLAQAIVLPCTSVIVIIVLLNEEFT
jgi:hypothetical protein